MRRYRAPATAQGGCTLVLLLPDAQGHLKLPERVQCGPWEWPADRLKTTDLAAQKEPVLIQTKGTTFLRGGEGSTLRRGFQILSGIEALAGTRVRSRGARWKLADWLRWRTKPWLESLSAALEEARNTFRDPVAGLVRAIMMRPDELEADARSLLFAHVRAVELPEPEHLAPLPVLVDVPALDYAEPTEGDRLRRMLLQLRDSMIGGPKS